ncbi:uncharacterized protein E0L32_009955 [Thyridium curvatum]|uniref:C2H2-type domain-containing protein n=1 Tax=Thyridium curvatum TaxID=1093900 RepID=A0A507APG7_9PEZI|nr:uncharacterized protein E0L32_009955 [Thyridium curvatum]TPX08616.1 hypothetical protein E0L32_009955 [Thyridium curvatum]
MTSDSKYSEPAIPEPLPLIHETISPVYTSIQARHKSFRQAAWPRNRSVRYFLACAGFVYIKDRPITCVSCLRGIESEALIDLVASSDWDLTGYHCEGCAFTCGDPECHDCEVTFRGWKGWKTHMTNQHMISVILSRSQILEATSKPSTVSSLGKRTDLKRSGSLVSTSSLPVKKSKNDLPETLHVAPRTVASLTPSPKHEIEPCTPELSQLGATTVVSTEPSHDIMALVSYDWDRKTITVISVEQIYEEQSPQRLTASEIIRKFSLVKGGKESREGDDIPGVARLSSILALMTRDEFENLQTYIRFQRESEYDLLALYEDDISKDGMVGSIDVDHARGWFHGKRANDPQSEDYSARAEELVSGLSHSLTFMAKAAMDDELIHMSIREEVAKYSPDHEDAGTSSDEIDSYATLPLVSNRTKRPPPPARRRPRKRNRDSDYQPSESPEPIPPKITTFTKLSQTAISTVVSFEPTVPEDVVTVITYNWEREDTSVAAVEELEHSEEVPRLTALEAIRRIAPVRGWSPQEENDAGIRRPVHTTLTALMRRGEYLKLVDYVHAFRAIPFFLSQDLPRTLNLALANLADREMGKREGLHNIRTEVIARQKLSFALTASTPPHRPLNFLLFRSFSPRKLKSSNLGAAINPGMPHKMSAATTASDKVTAHIRVHHYVEARLESFENRLNAFNNFGSVHAFVPNCILAFAGFYHEPDSLALTNDYDHFTVRCGHCYEGFHQAELEMVAQGNILSERHAKGCYWKRTGSLKCFTCKHECADWKAMLEHALVAHLVQRMKPEARNCEILLQTARDHVFQMVVGPQKLPALPPEIESRIAEWEAADPINPLKRFWEGCMSPGTSMPCTPQTIVSPPKTPAGTAHHSTTDYFTAIHNAGENNNSESGKQILPQPPLASNATEGIAAHQAEMEALKGAHDKAIGELKREHEAELARTQAVHEDKLISTQQENAEKTRLVAIMAAELARMQELRFERAHVSSQSGEVVVVATCDPATKEVTIRANIDAGFGNGLPKLSASAMKDKMAVRQAAEMNNGQTERKRLFWRGAAELPKAPVAMEPMVAVMSCQEFEALCSIFRLNGNKLK